jgi:tungstate transport system permease protein
MSGALTRAFELLFSGDGHLWSIVSVTMQMTLTSSVAALLFGVPLGVFYATARFPGRKALIILNRTLTGLPPVVCGLLCYMLFSGVGPLRQLTPIVAANIEMYVGGIAGEIRETARGLGLARGRTFLLTLNESKYALVSTYLFGYGRAMAEVGAVSMVGGAIAYKTNVMTTAIMMYTNMGDFTLGLALGVLLLGISLIVNIAAHLLQGRRA